MIRFPALPPACLVDSVSLQRCLFDGLLREDDEGLSLTYTDDGNPLDAVCEASWLVFGILLGHD